jgi:SAM-dependent methyltransferase
MAAKAVLNRLPVPYHVWAKAGLMRYGRMDEPEYAFEVVTRHVEAFKRYSGPLPSGGFTSLELGPGDALSSAAIIQRLGGSASFLVDVARFAREDAGIYRRLEEYLTGRGLTAPSIRPDQSLEDLLQCWRCQYLTRGLDSLRALPDSSLDLIWSHAVLQSIPLSDYDETLRQFSRLLREGGITSHVIDMRDMLGGALNHLRFSSRFWESGFVRNSGFYTNRIRHQETVERFQRYGFELVNENVESWPELPTARGRMDARYSELSDPDLRIYSFHSVFRKRRAAVSPIDIS